MQRGERAARNQSCKKSPEAQREVHSRQLLLGLLLAIQHPAEVKHHYGEKVCREAKKTEQEIGRQCANTTHPVADISRTRCLAEAGVCRIVGHERKPQNQRQRAEYIQRTFAQGAVHLRR